MKLKLILSLIMLSIISTTSLAHNYKKGDTLNVVAVNGLYLRGNPNTNSKKIKKLNCKSQVIILNTFNFQENQDSIDGFKGNWVYVVVQGEKGYVFDAYISTLPILSKTNDLPSVKSLELHPDGIFELYPDLLEDYTLQAFKRKKDSCDYFYESTQYEGHHSLYLYHLKNEHNFIKHGYWEGYASELELIDVRDSEIYFYLIHLNNAVLNNKISLDKTILKSLTDIHTCVVKNPGSKCFIQIIRKSKNKTSIFVEINI